MADYTEKERTKDLIECWKAQGLSISKILINLLKMKTENITRIKAFWQEDKYLTVETRKGIYESCYWCTNCNYGINAKTPRYCEKCGAKIVGVKGASNNG